MLTNSKTVTLKAVPPTNPIYSYGPRPGLVIIRTKNPHPRELKSSNSFQIFNLSPRCPTPSASGITIRFAINSNKEHNDVASPDSLISKSELI